MKRLLSISVAILLVASFGIAMIPPQSVEASPSVGKIFNITAKGQGDYTISSSTSGTGKFSISLHGQASSKYHGGWGGFAPYAEVGGHISGSFDGHTVNAGLQGNQVHFNCHCDRPLNLIHLFGLRASGNYDGNAIKTAGWNHVWVYGDEDSRTVQALLYHSSIGGYLRIYIYEASADNFKVEIRKIGN